MFLLENLKSQFCSWCGIPFSLYSAQDVSPLVAPNYGKNSCFISWNATGIYLYYPAAILLALNWIFFFLTFYKLYEYNKSTKMATQNVETKRTM